MLRVATMILAGLSLLPAAPQPGALPAGIATEIRKMYHDEVRYLDASVDLNDDGRPELVVHVVGTAACGSGGCQTLVFTPSGNGYRLVSTISVTGPPIKASATRTAGWRNLIVHVSGGGAKPRDVELMSDGKSYPTNPTVVGPQVKAASSDGELLIKAFASPSEAKPLP
jgi:hypothetical protein